MLGNSTDINETQILLLQLKNPLLKMGSISVESSSEIIY